MNAFYHNFSENRQVEYNILLGDWVPPAWKYGVYLNVLIYSYMHSYNIDHICDCDSFCHEISFSSMDYSEHYNY